VDRWLVARVLAGNTGAAEELVRRHYAGVHRFLFHLTRHAEDASDLTQQVFGKLQTALPGYRREGSFRGWLFRIAYREFLHWHRDREPMMEPLPDDLCGRTLTPDAWALLDAIEELPEEQRVPFLLREVEGLSVREIAESLGIPEGTVKSRCHLAKARLRQKLAPAWGHPAQALEADHVV
jgi:RNA polymerase sigma-70 factor (ECF subfamily)